MFLRTYSKLRCVNAILSAQNWRFLKSPWCVATFSTDSSNSQEGMNKSPESKRKRHRFRAINTDEIPSFYEFQQQIQVRNLYRMFLRLSSDYELRDQIRREFRESVNNSTMDSWHTKRALSEGTRRYKELSAMLSSTPRRKDAQQPKSTPQPSEDSKTTGGTDSSAETTLSNWPWQRNSGEHKPFRLPSKFDK